VRIISNEELATRAGVDPWAEHQKLASGDPAQVEQLAATFAKAGGDMGASNAYQSNAQHYVAEGYTIDGSSPVDFEAEVRSTSTTPEHMLQIGKTLAGIAGSLDTATNSAGTDVANLETTLNGIDGQWTQFMQQIGHHLPPDDQKAARDELIGRAVTATRNTGKAIQQTITGYEEHLLDAQKLLADLGYVPPDKVDDLSGDAKIDIAALQKKARDEADRLKNNLDIDGKWGKDAHQVAQDVAPYLDDPYFASAFYGELGPQLTQLLPDMLHESGSDSAGGDLKTFSHLFGTAVTNSGDDGNMQAVKDSFLHPPIVASQSWDRAAMVSNGSFPPDWLADAARVNSLDVLAHNGPGGFGGRGFDGAPAGQFAGQVGMPTDVVAAWTNALGHNPEASREALATMGNAPGDMTVHGDPTAAYEKNIHTLVDYGHRLGASPDVARGYGATFEAASGADNEVDGSHSQGATEFTRALFNDMAHDSGNVQPQAAQNFARIGASYVQEMAAGHGMEGDTTGAVNPNDAVLGDHPAFGIPPDATREFMKTFVGDHTAMTTFDDAAQAAANHALHTAATADVDLVRHGQAPHHLADTSGAYGTVAGAENGAETAVVGAQAEDQAHQKELLTKVLTTGVELVPGGKLVEGGREIAWGALKAGTNLFIEHTNSGPPSLAQQHADLQNTTYLLGMANDYQQTATLVDAGYPGAADVPPELLDGSGHLKPVNVVMNDEHLKAAYYDYVHGAASHTGQGGLGPGASMYEITRNAAARYHDGFDAGHGPGE
jgi:Hydrolase N-terminal helical domain